MSNPIVTSLPAYVEQQSGLIAQSILSSRTAQLFHVQTGVKGTAAINLLNTAITFGNGAACGWTPAGTSTLSQRNIVTGMVKVNMAYCDKLLIGKYAEHQVRIAAGQKTLPFEAEFIKDVTDNIGFELEKALWQGDTASSTNNLSYFDGMLKILAAEGSSAIAATGTRADPVAAVKAVLTAIATSAPVLLEKQDVAIFCSPSFFVSYTQALIAANLYHYDAGQNLNDFIVPGTSIKLTPVGGLIGIDKLVAGSRENLYLGCDLASDASTFKLWYSDDADEFRLKVEFNAGTQTAFPNQVVVATLS